MWWQGALTWHCWAVHVYETHTQYCSLLLLKLPFLVSMIYDQWLTICPIFQIQKNPLFFMKSTPFFFQGCWVGLLLLTVCVKDSFFIGCQGSKNWCGIGSPEESCCLELEFWNTSEVFGLEEDDIIHFCQHCPDDLVEIEGKGCYYASFLHPCRNGESEMDSFQDSSFFFKFEPNCFLLKDVLFLKVSRFWKVELGKIDLF